MNKNSTLLAVDIGNTVIHCGVFCGSRLVRTFSLPSAKRSPAFYRRSVRRLVRENKINSTVDGIVMCSVVPALTAVVRGALEKSLKKNVLIAGKDLSVSLKNTYKNPRQLGIDRLLAAYAAVERYGPGVIIIDFGTAVTFDVVTKKGEFSGGMIFPGLDLSLDALYHHTALLPRIKIADPRNLIGRDTKSCMTAGIVFGMAGVCDGIIRRLRRRFKGYKVVATGGNISFIQRYSKEIKNIQPSLVLQGLNLLFRNRP